MATVNVLGDGATLVQPTQQQPQGLQALQWPSGIGEDSSKHSTVLCFTFESTKPGAGSGSSLHRSRAKRLTDSKAMLSTDCVLMLPTTAETPLVQVQNQFGNASFVSEMMQAGAGAINGLANAKGDLSDIGSAVLKEGGALASLAGGKVTSYIQSAANDSAVTGQTIQGRESVSSYQKTDNNSFQFRWRMVPRNKSELRNIWMIVREMTAAASGTVLGTASFEVAPEFEVLDLKFKKTVVQDPESFRVQSPKIVYVEERAVGIDRDNLRFAPRQFCGPAQIKELRVVPVTSDEVYGTFSGTAGDPIGIDVTLVLQELVPRYSDTWESLFSTLGKSISGVPIEGIEYR